MSVTCDRLNMDFGRALLSPFESSQRGSVDDDVINTSDVPDEDLNHDLWAQFANETRDIAKSKYHRKVAVLLLSWKVESKACMDTTEELDRLEEVFKDTYHYSVHRALLSTRGSSGSPKHQLKEHFAKFLRAEDDENTLLIIYYGGHGLHGSKTNGFRILGGNPSTSQTKRRNEIVWKDSGDMLHDADADLLLIFDCCHAGDVISPSTYSGFTNKIFEFIGSSGRNQPSAWPGKESFTNAFIESLKTLAHTGAYQKSGFTMTTLVNEVCKHPGFKHTQQVPISSELGRKPSYKRLVMMPLLEQMPVVTGPETQQKAECAKFFLTLDLRFTEQPSPQHIQDLAHAFKELVRHHNFPIEQVEWAGLSRTLQKFELTEAACKIWCNNRMKRRVGTMGKWPLPGEAAAMPPRTASFYEQDRRQSITEAQQANGEERLEQVSSRGDLLFAPVSFKYSLSVLTSFVFGFALGVMFISVAGWSVDAP